MNTCKEKKSKKETKKKPYISNGLRILAENACRTLTSCWFFENVQKQNQEDLLRTPSIVLERSIRVRNEKSSSKYLALSTSSPKAFTHKDSGIFEEAYEKIDENQKKL